MIFLSKVGCAVWLVFEVTVMVSEWIGRLNLSSWKTNGPYVETLRRQGRRVFAGASFYPHRAGGGI
jgi:hypothetical protein